jgi:hypothetical protein
VIGDDQERTIPAFVSGEAAMRLGTSKAAVDAVMTDIAAPDLRASAMPVA